MKNKRKKSAGRSQGLLDGARVYLSGPMDFVASREEEMKNGWRTRLARSFASEAASSSIRGRSRAFADCRNTAAKGWTRPRRARSGRSRTAAGRETRSKLTREVLGDAPHRSADGRHERLHDRVLSDEHLQRRHAARDRAVPSAAQAGAVREPAGRVPGARRSARAPCRSTGTRTR